MFGRYSERLGAGEVMIGGQGAAHQIDSQTGAGVAEGIVAGTRIATDLGWRPVETILPGDMVMTFDHGMRPVVAVSRAALWSGEGRCPRAVMPLAVPVGALGNTAPMLLLPEQNVLVESDLADAVFGDPFALVPAAALQGYRAIDRITPHQSMDVLVLHFAADELVYANGAGLIHCASDTAGQIDAPPETEPLYAVLPLDMARAVVAAMIEEERRG